MVGVTPSTTMADATMLAAPFGLFRDHISLMHGWVPIAAQVLAVAAAGAGHRAAQPPLAAGVTAHRGGAGPCADRGDVLEHLLQRPVRRTCAAVAVGLGDADRTGRRSRRSGLAFGRAVAAHRLAAGRADVGAVRRADAEPVGRLLPHRADRLGSADRRSAARSDRSRHRRENGCGQIGSGQGQGGAGEHHRAVEVQAPRRVRVPAARLLRQRPTARAADRHDDRRSVQYRGGLDPRGQRRGHHRRFRGPQRR